MSPLPRQLLLIVVSTVLAGCATGSQHSPRGRAIVEAAENLLDELHAKQILPASGTAAADDTGLAVIIDASDDIHPDLSVELDKWVTVVPRGDVQARLIAHLTDELREVYKQQAPIPDKTREVLQGLEAGVGLGSQRKADLLVLTDVEEYARGRFKVTLLAYDLAEGRLVATGVGKSHGSWHVVKTGLVWVATPVVLLYDVARHSVKYAFDDAVDPGIMGTLGNAIVSVIYLPFAFFTCDYEITGRWVRE